MSELSKKHGMDMHKKQDAAHLEAMAVMGELMKDPDKMNAWFESRQQEFEELPDE